ncbi:hypothetical protein V8E36_007413 [Tilletia maclaganii]
MPPKQTAPPPPGAGAGRAPPSRGIVPSRGAAFSAGIGRGAGIPPTLGGSSGGGGGSAPVPRPIAAPHFVPIRPRRPPAASSPAPASVVAGSSSAAAPSPGSANASAATGSRGGRGGRGGGGGAGGGGGGRGGRGGGRGGGAAGAPSGPRAPIEMTASGPFALGTGATRAVRNKTATAAPILTNARSQASSSATAQDGAPGSISNAIVPGAGAGASSKATSGAAPPDPAGSSAVKRDTKVFDIESAPFSQDGLRIIDIQDVPLLDERAPAVIPRYTVAKNTRRKAGKRAVKGEDAMAADEDDTAVEAEDEMVDMSESDHEEEEPDDLAGFFMQVDGGPSPENRLYQFQIPRPFPRFIVDPNYAPPQPTVKAEPEAETLPDTMDTSADLAADEGAATEDAKPSTSSKSGLIIPNRGAASSVPAAPSLKPKRSVSFAADTVGGPGSARDGDDDVEIKGSKLGGEENLWRGNPEGQIGEITIWKDGSVKLHMGSIVMNLSAALQHTFLQHVMALDDVNHKAYTLGELQQKFIATPDIDYTLADYEQLVREEDAEEERLRVEEERRKREAERVAAEAAARRKERAASGSVAGSGSGSSAAGADGGRGASGGGDAAGKRAAGKRKA